jgi:DNA-binding CsgD family transcriptional regulator
MYWDSVLNEVLNKKSQKQPFTFTNVNATVMAIKNHNKSFRKKNSHSRFRTYLLGKKQPGKYFTKRETECMVMFLKGRTINRTAETLGLSPRTVEFYLKNMKNKLQCGTKCELIEAIQNSEFLKHVDLDL